MTICLRCGRDTGFLGFLRVNYNKQTRHCRKCEDEVQRTLEDFRTAFLELTRDGTLTPQKWEILAKSATDDKIEIDTILTFIHQDILNLWYNHIKRWSRVENQENHAQFTGPPPLNVVVPGGHKDHP